MSKPKKPGELQDVEVSAISLVPKAANGERFKIFKSATEEEAPETVNVNKDERGLFRILKNFFTKGEVADMVTKSKAKMTIQEAYWALMKVIFPDDGGTIITDSKTISEALEDFTEIVSDSLHVKIIKSGRKISGSRLSKLRDIQVMLNEVLTGVDDSEETETTGSTDSTGGTEVSKDEIEKIMTDALSPIMERIGKIENARGYSNRIIEENNVKKNNDNFWGEIF